MLGSPSTLKQDTPGVNSGGIQENEGPLNDNQQDEQGETIATSFMSQMCILVMRRKPRCAAACWTPSDCSCVYVIMITCRYAHWQLPQLQSSSCLRTSMFKATLCTNFCQHQLAASVACKATPFQPGAIPGATSTNSPTAPPSGLSNRTRETSRNTAL
jgi:hypothetical protein